MKKRGRLRKRRHHHDERLHRTPQQDSDSVQQQPDIQTMSPEAVFYLPRRQQQMAVQSMAGHYSNQQIQRYVDLLQRAAGPQQHQTLRIGTNSPEVETLQTQLNGAGANLAVDGIFGPQTRQAVIQFQRAAGLAPDGVVGPQTWSSLTGGGVKIPPSPAAMGQMIAAKLQQINTLVKNRKQQSANLKQQTFNEPDVEADNDNHAGHAHDWGHDDDDSWWDTASDWVDEQVDSASEWVDEKTEDAASWVDEQVDSASEWVEDTWDDVTDTAGDVWDSVSDTAGDVWDSATDTASDVWDAVKDTANEIVEDIKEITTDIRDLVEEGVDRLIDIASGNWGDDPLSYLDKLIKELTGDSEDENEKKEVAKEGTASPFTLAALGGAIGCDLPVRFEPETASSVESGAVDNPMANDITKPGTVVIGPSTTQGIPVPGGAFGYAEPKFGADSITWKFGDNDVVTIGARVTVDCRYDINSLGKADITDPESDKVTENNWETILWDLKPDSDGRPPRSIFWSSPITQAHEIYHCNEYISEAGKSLDSRKSMLNGHWIDEPWFWESEDDAAEIRAQIQGYLKKMVAKIQQDVFDHYKNGGEDRAYGSGTAAYEALLEGIKKRAAREGWDKPEKESK